MANLIGQSLGRYHILEQLGEGGMATVYKAFDTRLERNVAIKVILPGKQHSEKFLKRFEREAKALAGLSHPNIVGVIDYGEQDGMPYLVMEYLPGGTLKHKLSGKPMPWQEAARILIPIARALAYAHDSKIIHRDVKPSNILITQSGEPMLSDFGIAKMLETEETLDLTGTGVGVGTPEYMSPEQAQGKQVDARSDIYSLGVVFYEMVTGRKPYQADTPMAVAWKLASEPLPRPKEFIKELPDPVEQILLKTLAKSPENRYTSFSLFIIALEKLGIEEFVLKKNDLTIKKRYQRVTASILGIILLAMIIFFADSHLSKNSQQKLLQPDEYLTTDVANTLNPADYIQVQQTLEPQFLEQLTVSANSNQGISFQVSKSGLYIFQYAGSAYTTCSDCTWATTVYAFLGKEAQWEDSNNYIQPNYEAALFVMGPGGHSTRETAVGVSQGRKVEIQLNTGDWITLVTDDEKQSYGNNSGELLIDIFIVPHIESSDVENRTYLVFEDFEDEQIQMFGFSADSDRWEIIEDGTGNLVYQVYNRNGDTYHGFAFGTDEWSDYVTEFRIKLLNENAEFGLQVRSNTTNSYYVIDFSTSFLYLAYPTPEEWDRITTSYPPIQTNVWHTVRVDLQGDHIQVYVDGSRWIDERDSRYSHGEVMFFASPGTYAQVDDIKVWEQDDPASQASQSQGIPLNVTATGESPSLVPSSDVPLYDDFSDNTLDSAKWSAPLWDRNQAFVPTLADGRLGFSISSKWADLAVNRAYQIEEMYALVTLEQPNGGALGFTLRTLGEQEGFYGFMLKDNAVAVWDLNGSEMVKVIRGNTHLLGVKVDGQSITFYLDNQLIGSYPLKGFPNYATLQIVSGGGTTSGYVSKVWVKFLQ